MRIGSLRKRIAIKEQTSLPDGAGGTETVWTEVLQTFASIRPISGKRAFEYNTIIQATFFDITIRYRKEIEINKNNVIDWEGREIIIHSVINKDELNKSLEIVGYTRL